MKRKIIATAMMVSLISGTVDCYAAFPPVVTASWQSNYTKVPYELVSDTAALEETGLEDVVDVTGTYTEEPEEEEEPATPTDLSTDEVEEQISSYEVVIFTSGADQDSVVSDTTSYDGKIEPDTGK